MTPTLLTLPRELRDKILSYLIASHTPPLKEASKEESERRTTLKDIKMKSWDPVHPLMHVKRLNRAEFIPTLLVNRQLHAETMAVIELFPKNYVIHAILVNEKQLWPTWVSAPAFTTRIERLHFSVKSVGPRLEGRSGWRIGDGSPPPITWYFYSLLERVLKVGPMLGQRQKIDGRFSIKNLDIEVLSPDVSPEKLAPEDEFPDKAYRHRADFLMDGRIVHPKMLMRLLKQFLGYLLGMSYHQARYGAILYERIGKIRMILDGEVLHEFDLAERLQGCRFNDSFGNVPRENRESTFKKWKVNTYKTRIELGLPVIPDDRTEEQV